MARDGATEPRLETPPMLLGGYSGRRPRSSTPAANCQSCTAIFIAGLAVEAALSEALRPRLDGGVKRRMSDPDLQKCGLRIADMRCDVRPFSSIGSAGSAAR